MEDSVDQFLAAQEFRRNCGVGLQSKRAMILIGRVSRDELAKAGAERSFAVHYLLGEAREVGRDIGAEGEHVPDLRIFRPAFLHYANHVCIGPWLRIVFYAREKHRLHLGVFV